MKNQPIRRALRPGAQPLLTLLLAALFAACAAETSGERSDLDADPVDGALGDTTAREPDDASDIDSADDDAADSDPADGADRDSAEADTTGLSDAPDDAATDAAGDVATDGPPADSDDPSDAEADTDVSDTAPTDTAPTDTPSVDTPSVDTAPEPVCGDGVVDPGEECDDGGRADGDLCSSTCTHSYACPALPTPCGGASPTTTEHHLVPAAECSFALVPWDDERVEQRSALIDAIAARARETGSMTAVLGNLNREGRTGITANNAHRLRNHEWRGFRWNSGDDGVSYWYPQGITGSSDAFAGGTLDGRNLVLASWYHNSDDRPTKGVRISVADITDLDDVRYRHLLLIEPTGTVDAPNFRSVRTGSGGALHAGGIAWWGDLLYVADTTGGFRVFDLSRIMRVTHSDDTSRIGLSPDRFDALGYAYAVPELTRFELAPDSCALRFSFVGLDRSSTPPALVSGEYRRDDVGGRIAIWDLDPATGLLDVRSGEVRATEAFVSGQTRMQGALRYEGNVYISSSSQYESYGRLYRTREGFGESTITAWVYGAEDLYMERAADVVWTAAEFPANRDVVGIPLRRP